MEMMLYWDSGQRSRTWSCHTRWIFRLMKNLLPLFFIWSVQDFRFLTVHLTERLAWNSKWDISNVYHSSNKFGEAQVDKRFDQRHGGVYGGRYCECKFSQIFFSRFHFDSNLEIAYFQGHMYNLYAGSRRILWSSRWNLSHTWRGALPVIHTEWYLPQVYNYARSQ